jgi:hypothetical protein
MSFWWLFIIIFVIDFVVSYGWAKAVKGISDNDALKAALWAGFITLSGGISTISFIINHWLLFPAVLGSMVGTYVAVKFKKHDN